MIEKFENWRELAQAIIMQAVIDFRGEDLSYNDYPESEEALKRFFVSPWFSMLTTVDGARLLRTLQEERLSA